MYGDYKEYVVEVYLLKSFVKKSKSCDEFSKFFRIRLDTLITTRLDFVVGKGHKTFMAPKYTNNDLIENVTNLNDNSGNDRLKITFLYSFLRLICGTKKSKFLYI